MGLFDSAAGGASAGAMGGPVGAAIGGGVGLLAGLFGHSAEKKKEQNEAMMRAAEQSASPWTGMAPSTKIEFASPLAGKLLGGAGAGLGMAQSLGNAGTQSPWASMGAQQQSGALAAMPPVGQVADNGMNGMMLDNQQKNPMLYGNRA